jgi:hypothetical protein
VAARGAPASHHRAGWRPTRRDEQHRREDPPRALPWSDWPIAKEFVVEAVVPCESEVCALWRGLSGTDWLDRAMGHEPLQVEAASTPGSAARCLVKTHLGGFEVAWNERPCEFEVARSLRVRRDLVFGPARPLDVEYTTEVRGGAARRGCG